jgi:hypothetical protein
LTNCQGRATLWLVDYGSEDASHSHGLKMRKRKNPCPLICRVKRLESCHSIDVDSLLQKIPIMNKLSNCTRDYSLKEGSKDLYIHTRVPL